MTIRVRIVAPGRTLPPPAAERARQLAEAEFRGRLTLDIDDQCFLEHGHFAGPDERRADALLAALNDPAVDAIWLARGGYGACRLLQRILRGAAPSTRKPVIGYSDGGFLLSALGARRICLPVHGPMVADGLREGGEEALRRVLLYLCGDDTGVEASVRQSPGAAAFTLAVLASLVSTPHMISLRNRVLLVEEVGEHLYAIDRMLFTVFESGKLEGCSGLRRGRISDVPENDVPFGEDAETIFRRWCADYDIAYLGRADIGHDIDNKIVPFAVD